MIKVIWKGGPRWNPKIPSSTNPSKSKSAVEHLIETGGQTIDETITAMQKFGSFELKAEQYQPEDESINWVTSITINETDPEISLFVKNMMLEHYEEKRKWLETSGTGYSIIIEEND